MNRRDFCSSVVAATTLTTCTLATAGASWPCESAPAALVRPYRLIFDRRFPASRMLGAEFARRGLLATAFSGDVTALWFHDLGPRWAASRTPVAGITTPGALLCLEQMARDAWMRVTVRAEHDGSDVQPCGHRVTGTAADVARICTVLDAGANWPARLAAALAETSTDDGRRPVQRSVVGGGSWSNDGRTPRLVSWIITA